MPLSTAELAAHALRVKSPQIAWAAVAALYRQRPDLEHRYGEAGRRRCAKDLGHHLRFLAAAVEMSDARVFADYAAWAVRVMVTHGVAHEDALDSFRCLVDAAPDAVPVEARPFVRDVLRSAVWRVESEPAPRPSRHFAPLRPPYVSSN